MEVGECLLQIDNQPHGHPGLHDNVIDVDFQVAADLLPKTPLHTPLEGDPSVLAVERHGGVVEGAERGDEGCGQLVQGVHCDLVVPRVHV